MDQKAALEIGILLRKTHLKKQGQGGGSAIALQGPHDASPDQTGSGRMIWVITDLQPRTNTII